MSATSPFLKSCLLRRSQDVRPGVKKLIKSDLTRAQRQTAKRSLAGEIRTMAPLTSLPDLNDLSPAELELYADAFLLASRPEDEAFYDTEGSNDLTPQDFFAEAPANVPLHLLGALPDWMVAQLEAANGDAFAALSLFEAKSPSPKAAISMEDEKMYA